MWTAPDWIADTSQLAEEEGLVTGARYYNYVIDRVCVRDEGIFYVGEDKLASYYDFESGESYYLCSNPNCKHDSGDCIAYAESQSRFSAGITGLAWYGGYCYYLVPHRGDCTWELIRVDLSEQTKTVIATFGNDGSQENDVTIERIDDTLYCDGKVWIEAILHCPDSLAPSYSTGYQLFAIDLADGAVTEITSPQQPPICFGLTFDAYGEGKLAIQQNYFHESGAPLTQEEFEAQGGLEQYGEDVEAQDALTEAEKLEAYGSYLDKYYFAISADDDNDYIREFILDTETMELTELYSGPYYTCGEVIAIANGKAFLVVWEGSGQDESNTITSMDLNTGESEPFYVIERGCVLAWKNALQELYNSSGILCVQYKDVDGETRGDICVLDAYTGEMQILFEDYWGCSFRPVAQLSDKLIGRTNKETKYAWLSREEYESGSTDYHEIMTASSLWSAYWLGLLS